MSTRVSAIAALGFCGLSVLCSGGHAAEGDGTPFHTLLVGFAGVPTPDVTEDSKSGGTTTSYEWKDVKSLGFQGSVTLLNGKIRRDGGFVWGGDLVVSSYNITPGSYEVDGARFNNSSTGDLAYRTVGVNVVAGYQYGMTTENGLTGYLMVLPFIGGGAAWASSEVQTTNGYVKDDGTGTYFQYGVRLGGYLTERRWVYGIEAIYAGGIGKVDVDFSGGASSELTFEQSGFGFGGVAGYRF